MRCVAAQRECSDGDGSEQIFKVFLGWFAAQEHLWDKSKHAHVVFEPVNNIAYICWSVAGTCPCIQQKEETLRGLANMFIHRTLRLRPQRNRC